MRVRTIFVAYPYSFGMEYRAALERRFAGSGIEFRYADDELANTHVMAKLTRMMSEADLCFFDVTDSNANVLFELGYALGAQEPGFAVVRTDAAKELKSDIVGWDSLRYEEPDDLAAQLFEKIASGRGRWLRDHDRVFYQRRTGYDHRVQFGCISSRLLGQLGLLACPQVGLS